MNYVVLPDRLADSTSTNSSTTPFTEASGSSTTVIERMLQLGVVVDHRIQWLGPEISLDLRVGFRLLPGRRLARACGSSY